jgi:tagatose-6-phosphate ketose/aldose isomerase
MLSRRKSTMNPLSHLLALPEKEKSDRGLVHTPAEIAQQPETWQSTFDLFGERRSEISAFLRSAGLQQDVNLRPTVFLLGAGTSDYIGRSLTQLLRRLWQCEVLAVPSTDLLTNLNDWLLPGRRYLWISFSRSGESAEGVAVLQQALQARPDIHHLVVCCNAQGRMLRETASRKQVLGVALPDAVHDRGLAMTSSFSNMVVFGQCLANIGNLTPFRGILNRLVEVGKSFLEIAAESAAKLAAGPFRKVCFVGSGPLKAVAKESALKVLELTSGKTTTMSESGLGLRHGPMAALDEETLFVCFLSGEQRVQNYEIMLLEEIGRKRLVKTRVVVHQNPNLDFHTWAEQALVLDTRDPLLDDYRVPLDVIFGQLLGLFFSIRWKLKPDAPSPSGAISRVVQNVLTLSD